MTTQPVDANPTCLGRNPEDGSFCTNPGTFNLAPFYPGHWYCETHREQGEEFLKCNHYTDGVICGNWGTHKVEEYDSIFLLCDEHFIEWSKPHYGTMQTFEDDE